VRKAIASQDKSNRLQSSIAALEIIIMTQSAASNFLLQVGNCQKRILLPATDANAEVKEIFSNASKKSDRSSKEMRSPLQRNL
jgi:hypothetical protein